MINKSNQIKQMRITKSLYLTQALKNPTTRLGNQNRPLNQRLHDSQINSIRRQIEMQFHASNPNFD